MADPDADSDRPWLTLSEAAARSGRHLGALRSLVRRGRIPARKGNQGQWLVQLPMDEPLARPAAEPDPASGDAITAADEIGLELDALRAELLEALVVAAEAKAVAAAKDQVVAELRAQLAWHRQPIWRRWFG